MPPDGNEEASGSPWIRPLPENSARTAASPVGLRNESCFSAEVPGQGHEPVGVVRGAVGHGPLLDALGDRVGDGRVERLQALDRAAELLEDRLGEVLALGLFAEHVLAVDVLAGVLEVVLGGGDLAAGDCLDGLLASGHFDSYRSSRTVWPLPRFVHGWPLWNLIQYPGRKPAGLSWDSAGHSHTEDFQNAMFSQGPRQIQKVAVPRGGKSDTKGGDSDTNRRRPALAARRPWGHRRDGHGRGPSRAGSP